jgi:predicted RecB family nuclease
MLHCQYMVFLRIHGHAAHALQTVKYLCYRWNKSFNICCATDMQKQLRTFIGHKNRNKKSTQQYKSKLVDCLLQKAAGMLKLASCATISTDYMTVPSNSEPNRLSNSDLIIQQIYKYRVVSVIAYFF